jgi:5,10-methylene-tetrahydrofolate dehydrogenase/methenyl tetrahydrofolate cyclohydrolase
MALKEKRGVTPGITFVRVGEDPASQAYVRMKGAKAEELGIRSETIVLDETPAGRAARPDRKLNRDPKVHGILVQAPLPRHIKEEEIFSAIDFRKDVDGFHPVNVGKLLLGQNPLFKPCTPAGVHELLIRTGVPLSGAEVVILGRGNIVGKPMAAILLQKEKHADATVTVLHSRSRNIAGPLPPRRHPHRRDGPGPFRQGRHGQAGRGGHRRGRESRGRSRRRRTVTGSSATSISRRSGRSPGRSRPTPAASAR